MATPDLQGCRVVVTRPAHQAAALIQAIEDRGGEVLAVPVLAIAGPDDPTAVQAQLADLAHYQFCIFISANAVTMALPLLPAASAWPASTRIAAVGAATARALAEAGLAVAIQPTGDFSSEGLLAQPALQRMHGQQVLIVRGAGGRETLAEQLRERGARVDYVEVYRRCVPTTDTGPLLERLHQGSVDFIVVTSSEGLHNLFAMVGTPQAPLLQQATFILFSARTAQAARELGVQRPPLVTAQASDEGIITTLRAAWRSV